MCVRVREREREREREAQKEDSICIKLRIWKILLEVEVELFCINFAYYKDVLHT